MPRSVKEWVGKTDDTTAPRRVRLRVFEAHGGRCANCSRKLAPGDRWDLDHIKPLKDGGGNREGNLQPLCVGCHGPKTRGEAHQRAEGARHRAKQAGIKKPTRGFPTNRHGRFKKKIDGTVVKR